MGIVIEYPSFLVFFVNKNTNDMKMNVLSLLSDANRKILIFLGIFWMLSCNNPEYTSSIDLSDDQDVSAFDVFSSIEIVDLETIDKSLISGIRRLQYFDSRYYILDQTSQKIYCFDANGHFLFNIDSQGKGPGQYHYITDFRIDKLNQQIVLLDPVVQRVHFFDITGNFIETHDVLSNEGLGLNRVYPLPDSLLLFFSFSNEDLLFYSLREQRILFSRMPFSSEGNLHGFIPNDNVFFYEDKVLYQLPLSREIEDITEIHAKPYYTWCFGRYNNSDEQINNLIGELRLREQDQNNFLHPWHFVGKNKILTHHLIKSHENKRFRIAIVEFDDNFKFVIIDKTTNNVKVFSAFQEGITMPFEFMFPDRIVMYNVPELGQRDIERLKTDGLYENYIGRNRRFYNSDILNEDCRKILENHNPMTDNPFLVVYKFKE